MLDDQFPDQCLNIEQFLNIGQFLNIEQFLINDETYCQSKITDLKTSGCGF